MRSSHGMWMTADLSFDEAHRPFDTVLVAGGPFLPTNLADDRLSAWLQRWGILATRYGSI